MEIKVDLPGVSVNQTLIVNDDNLGKLAEAVQQYLKSKREFRKPEIPGE
jgi:hypothetical protein